VVVDAGQGLAALYAERMPLYRAWAELTLETDSLSHEEVVARLAVALESG
jgi:shikimate kinase